jgi:RepB DNA-primase from phage plasmid/Primase C terminal 2 (PriCT-2)/AAA domain
VFVTINETDFQGRRLENIVRPRALFVDADDADQLRRCEEAIHATGATPTMVVRTSHDRAHFYFCCEDLSLEEFSTVQAALIERLGTDPAIKDLSRVMRLPGTLHLKDPAAPQKVTLEKHSSSRRWKVRELTSTLALTTTSTTRQQPVGGRLRNLVGNPAFTPAGAERLRRKFGPPTDDLSAGLDTNIEEIRSAVAAIPPSAITSEADWVKFMRALAHEARIYKVQAEEIWQIADMASRAAPGYDQSENRTRWLRYVDEALDRANPITIATAFDLAKKHGWQGWSPPTAPSGTIAAAGTGSSASGSAAGSPTSGLSVSFSNIPHRRWLYGVDLIRGEITVLAAPGGVGKSSLAIGISVSAGGCNAGSQTGVPSTT